jgi:diguanylate cyclase (GGDEF)-like protein
MTTADCVWAVDEAGVVREFQLRSGHPDDPAPEELIGRPLASLAGEDERARVEARLLGLLARPRRFRRLSFSIERSDGSRCGIEIGGAPVFDDARQFRGYFGGGHDISRLRAADEELKYRDVVGRALTRAFRKIVASGNPSAAIDPALASLARAMQVDSAVLLQNAADASGQVQIRQDWAIAGLDPSLPSRLADKAAFRTPDWVCWLADLRQSGLGVVDRRMSFPWAVELLDAAGAQSILFAPVHIDGAWWGALQLAACQGPRIWSVFERDVLRSMAELIGAALTGMRHKEARRSIEGELAIQGRLDLLTGLFNRKQFGRALEGAIAAAELGQGGFALHYLDLDHFKDVNETLGHPIGDRLLQLVAERLRHVVRRNDIVARFGGDEFALLQLDVTGPADASALAAKALTALKGPFLIDGHRLHIAASVGVALYEPGVREAETLLSSAELALYQAKGEGRQTFRFFTPALAADARQRLELGQDLRRALADHQFFLVYQAQVRSEDGKISALEALVRWRHPVRGVVLPSDFIPQCEANGFIVLLGEWILREACRQMREWLDAGIAPPVVSVNVSAVQLRQPIELERKVGDLMRAAGIPPGRLQLELTETTLMEAAKTQSDVLERLHKRGLKISLDDFGTGYSSLDYLHRYPVDQIKIAQVFVGGILDNNGDAAIVKAAISLARELGLRVVAEGVETAEQAKVLADWGCGEVQGFHFSRPATAEALKPALEAGFMRAAAGPSGQERTLALTSLAAVKTRSRSA